MSTSTLTKNKEFPATIVGKSMVFYGFVLLLGAGLRVITRMGTIYRDGYSIHNPQLPNPEVTIYFSLYGWISQLTIAISEIILIVVFCIAIARTRNWKVSIIAISHLIYAIDVISFPFLKPYYYILFYSSDNYQIGFYIEILNHIGALFLLLISDWFLYRLCDGDSHHNGLIMGVARNIPLGMIVVRLIEFMILTFYIGYNYYPLNTAFLIIPICWISLGLSLAPIKLFIHKQ